MRSGNLFSGVLVVAAAAAYFLLGGQHRPDGGRPDEIEYQGQKFKLTRAYADYHDYKNDPNNLDPAENARVERAVANARVADAYASVEEVSAAVGDVQFPGYGLTGFGERPQPDGTSLDVYLIEIPRADKDRVLVFRGRNGRYALVDDFVAASEPPITQVRESGGRLLYCGPDDEPLLSRPLADR
jgi:hypothetical protein